MVVGLASVPERREALQEAVNESIDQELGGNRAVPLPGLSVDASNIDPPPPSRRRS